MTPLAKSRLAAVISFVCPLLAFGMIWLYQLVFHGEDWARIVPGDDASNAAGAMLMFVEVVQIIFSVLIGAVIGILFSAYSLWLSRSVKSLGAISLAFNILPFLIILLSFFSRS